MLDNTTAQNNSKMYTSVSKCTARINLQRALDLLSGRMCIHSDVVDGADVLDQVHDELRALVGEEVHHVTKGTIGDSRAENGNVVLVRPVVDGVLVVDGLAKTIDDTAGSPARALAHLLVSHLLQHRHHEVLELAIVIVGDEQVAQAVDTLFAQVAALQLEVAQIRVSQALDEVFFDTTSSSDDGMNQVVLH